MFFFCMDTLAGSNTNLIEPCMKSRTTLVPWLFRQPRNGFASCIRQIWVEVQTEALFAASVKHAMLWLSICPFRNTRQFSQCFKPGYASARRAFGTSHFRPRDSDVISRYYSGTNLWPRFQRIGMDIGRSGNCDCAINRVGSTSETS